MDGLPLTDYGDRQGHYSSATRRSPSPDSYAHSNDSSNNGNDPSYNPVCPDNFQQNCSIKQTGMLTSENHVDLQSNARSTNNSPFSESPLSSIYYPPSSLKLIPMNELASGDSLTCTVVNILVSEILFFYIL